MGGRELLSSFVVCNPSHPRGWQCTALELNTGIAQNDPSRQSSMDQVSRLLGDTLAYNLRVDFGGGGLGYLD